MNTALQTAELGTKDIVTFLEKKRSSLRVTNVEDDPIYRAIDVDLKWEKRSQNTTQTLLLEVKVDNYFSTGNYFFETISNVEKNTPGCFLYSQADYLLYYYLHIELHVFDLSCAQEWFKKNQSRFETRQTSTPVGQNGGRYRTEGALVKRDVFAREAGCSLKVYKYVKGELQW